MAYQDKPTRYLTVMLLLVGLCSESLWAVLIKSPATCTDFSVKGQGEFLPGQSNILTFDSCSNSGLEAGYSKIFTFHDPYPCENCIGTILGCTEGSCSAWTMPGRYNRRTKPPKLLLSGDLGEGKFGFNTGGEIYYKGGEYVLTFYDNFSIFPLMSEIQEGKVSYTYSIMTQEIESNDECDCYFDDSPPGGAGDCDDDCVWYTSEEFPLFEVKGSFIVRSNPRETIDLFDLVFSPNNAVNGLSYFQAIRYDVDEYPFTRSYQKGNWNSETLHCDEYRHTQNSDIIAKDKETFRVKIPGWTMDVWTGVLDWVDDGLTSAMLPVYMASEGWFCDLQHKRISLSLGSYGSFYFNHDIASDAGDSPAAYKLSSIVHVPAERPYSEGNTIWRFAYEEDEQSKKHLTYIYNGSDPNDPEQSGRYYKLIWNASYDSVQQEYYNTAVNPTHPLRIWNANFDAKGRVIGSSSGCSSGCGGSGFGYERLEYQDSFVGYDNLVKKKYNANGDIVLRNDYRTFRFGPSSPEYKIAIPGYSFEWPRVEDGQFQDGVPKKWEIFSGQGDSVKLFNPSTSQLDSRYNAGEGIPEGHQVLTLMDGGIHTNIEGIGILPDTTYFLEVETNTFHDPNIGEFQAKVVAYDPNDPNNILNELIVIEVSENAEPYGFGSRLVPGKWLRQEGLWDSSDSPELVSKALRVILGGRYVDVDKISLSAVTFHGGETKPLLVRQMAVPLSPAEPNTLFVTWDYNCNDYSAVEKRWVDNQTARIIQYRYKNGTFSDVISKTEFEELNDDPAAPRGRVFTTQYRTHADPSDPAVLVSETLYPLGKRKDVEKRRSGHVIESYTEDIKSGRKVNVQTYTYSGSDVMTHTDARGGITEYGYWKPGLINFQKEPQTAAGQQITRYSYDDANRVKWQEQKNSAGTWIRTSYNYNPTTGFLDSVVVDDDNWELWDPHIGEKVTTRYTYNDFGQVIRETGADGVVTGKSYGLGGELKSEFVIAPNCNPLHPDPNLVLVSQTWYIYDNDGRIESLKRVKSEEPFAYGNPESVGDENQWITTHYEYDFLGRKRAVIEDADGLALRTEYEYNHQGEVKKVTQPNGQWTETYRNGRGLVHTQIIGHDGLEAPEWQVTEYEYNADGNIYKQTDSAGKCTIYEYDTFGRVEKVKRGISE